jgi:hypothetical protein
VVYHLTPVADECHTEAEHQAHAREMGNGSLSDHSIPQILIPYNEAEAITPKQAALIAGRAPRTMILWCHVYALGRRVGGQWRLSIVALAMHLDGNKEALRLYLSGDRSSPAVMTYYQRFAVPLVKDGRMPLPKVIGRRKVWDRRKLDLAFEALPEDGIPDANPWNEVA